MNYEVESKLKEKVDNWQFHALQQEVSSLKSENLQLKESLQRYENKFQNYYSAFETLQRVLLDSGQMTETNDLHNLMHYL